MVCKGLQVDDCVYKPLQHSSTSNRRIVRFRVVLTFFLILLIIKEQSNGNILINHRRTQMSWVSSVPLNPLTLHDLQYFHFD